MRKHKKKFCRGRDILKCDECEYVSQRAAEMRKHKRFCHGNEVLKCDNCEYESQRALDMRKHKKFCLGSEVKVKCEQIIQLYYSRHLPLPILPFLFYLNSCYGVNHVTIIVV